MNLVQTLFNLFVITEVFSLKIPLAGIGLKLMYPVQAVLILTLFLKTLQPASQNLNLQDAVPLVRLQWLLFLSICIPIILYRSPTPLTINYTVVLLSWVITLHLFSRNIRVTLKSFIRTYLFSIFALLALSIPAHILIQDERIDSIFGGGTNRLGLYSVIGLLLAFYLISNKFDQRYKNIYRIGFVVCLVTLILTFSRSAILALSVAVLEHTLRNRKIKLSQILMGITVAVAIAFYLNHMYVSTYDERYLKLMYRFGINGLLGHPYFDNYDEVSRAMHYENALALITSSWSSFVFGLGLESYRSADFLVNSRGQDITLHSMYLQYLMGGGIVALGCILFFIGTLYIRAIKLPNWQRDIIFFIFVPSLVHAAFLPAIFSREILIYTPLLILSCQLYNHLSNTRPRRQSEMPTS